MKDWTADAHVERAVALTCIHDANFDEEGVRVPNPRVIPIDQTALTLAGLHLQIAALKAQGVGAR